MPGCHKIWRQLLVIFTSMILAGALITTPAFHLQYLQHYV